MSDFIIATVSSCDLPKEYLQEHNIELLCYPYSIGGEDCLDDCDQDKQNAVYKRMRAGEFVDTSMINEYAYEEFFERLMSTGKDVLFLDMGKHMSSSHINKEKASDKINEKYKDAPNRLYSDETYSMSGGLGWIVDGARKQRDEGKSFDETILWVKDNQLHVQHWFTVDDLKWLSRTGRVSNAAAMVGGMFNIKPVLFTDSDGRLTVMNKVRGRKKALLTILERMKLDIDQPDGGYVIINHADCLEDAEFMKQKVKETFPNIGQIDIFNLSTIIGAHCGPGLFTIFYHGTHRYK